MRQFAYLSLPQAAKLLADSGVGPGPLNPVEEAKRLYKKDMEEKLNRRLSTLKTTN